MFCPSKSIPSNRQLLISLNRTINPPVVLNLSVTVRGIALHWSGKAFPFVVSKVFAETSYIPALINSLVPAVLAAFAAEKKSPAIQPAPGEAAEVNKIVIFSSEEFVNCKSDKMAAFDEPLECCVRAEELIYSGGRKKAF
jgi:hypothetical protein